MRIEWRSRRRRRRRRWSETGCRDLIVDGMGLGRLRLLALLSQLQAVVRTWDDIHPCETKIEAARSKSVSLHSR